MCKSILQHDFILLIMNCKKNSYKLQIQKQTWLKNILPSYIKYYHVIGDENLEREYFFTDDILFVKTPDDYNSLPKKVIESYKAIYKTFQFKYILKTDDDQMIDNEKFFPMITKLINEKIPKVHYAGHIIDIQKPHLSNYKKIHPELPEYLPILKTKYCNGRFYILSQEAVEDLITKRELIYKEYLEDYAIGFHLSEKYKKNILEIHNEKFFTDV